MAINYNKNLKKITSLEQKIKSLESEKAKLKDENLRVTQALNGTLHEIRRFSAEISNNAELLNRDLDNHDYRNTDELSKTVLYTAGLISSRLALTDLELNPRAIAFQSKVSSGVYKKFEKASHILKQRAKSKQINISFTNKSFMEIDTLPSFELVPFIILENAIKYSPNNQTIEVKFEEAPNMRNLALRVNSIGPIVSSNENHLLFDRGFRGVNAQKLSIGGEGLGLFLVKFLCDLHNIDVKITSDQAAIYTLANVPYSNFSINLNFSK